eukprot:5158844-Heterocapsa_arctica.AAC.2
MKDGFSPTELISLMSTEPRSSDPVDGNATGQAAAGQAAAADCDRVETDQSSNRTNPKVCQWR